MLPKPALLLTLVAAVLSGCATADAPEPATAVPATAPAPEPTWETLSAHGTFVAGFRSNPTLFPADFPRLAFNVTGNTTSLLIELAWHDPAQDLDAFANANVDPCPYSGLDGWACTVGLALDAGAFGEVRNRGGGPGMPDSPSRAMATQEDLEPILDLCGDPCPFGSYPTTNENENVAANVEWWNYVTIFHGPVPDGFTAIPQ